MKRYELLFTFISLILLHSYVPNIHASAQEIHTSHGLSRFGDLKYPKDFSHVDYVNPEATKGGHVRIAAVGILDTLNPYSQTGSSILEARPINYFFLGFLGLNEPLMIGTGAYGVAADEPKSAYGLIAESVEYPDDNLWISFTLRESARFHDGHPITADDVEFSYHYLKTTGPIRYQMQLSLIDRVEVLSKNKVRFYFKSAGNREQLFSAAELPVLPAHYWSDTSIQKNKLSPPLGSGPYQITKVVPGTSVTFSRVKDYWGKDLPINQGKYNFDKITLYFYLDLNVAFEAFKAGAVDMHFERISKLWANAYSFPDVQKGNVVKVEIPSKSIALSPVCVLNTRHFPFDDIKVRKALSYLLDFEWSNRTLFESAYIRSTSYFPNSAYASSGLPSDQELKLLSPFRDSLPEELFSKPFTLPKTDGSGQVRGHQKIALQLLKQSGWEVKNHKLINQDGKQLSFELITNSHAMDKVLIPYKKNLASIGIDMKYRVLDRSTYYRRVRNLDFDIIGYGFPFGLSPGLEMFRFFHSSNINIPDTQNLAGVSSPVVDHLLEQIPFAQSQQELKAILNTLDRTLLWNYYTIPLWYYHKTRVAMNSHIQRPDVETDFPVIISTWWLEE